MPVIHKHGLNLSAACEARVLIRSAESGQAHCGIEYRKGGFEEEASRCGSQANHCQQDKGAIENESL
jgi:hypothetical protein